MTAATATLARPRPTQPTTAPRQRPDVSDHDQAWFASMVEAEARHIAGGGELTADQRSEADCKVSEGFAGGYLPVTPTEAMNDRDNPIWHAYRETIEEALHIHGVLPVIDDMPNGEWLIDGDTVYELIEITDNDGRTRQVNLWSATVTTRPYMIVDTASIVRKMAAADEMLAALKDLREIVLTQNGNLHDDINQLLKRVDETIASAEGRTS